MSAVAEQEAAVEGTGQLSFAVGGKKPTGSSLRIVGGRVEVNGQYEKGDLLEVTMVVRVCEVGFVDETDEKTQQVVGCERRHKARPATPPRVVPADAIS